MELSVSQLQTLKTWLDANAIGVQDEEAAGLLNVLASPDFWVWRTAVTKAEITEQQSIDATNFVFAGNGFIARSTGELTCWEELFSTGACNPSLANVRQAFQDIFSGTGNAATNRTHLLVVARRKSTVGEKLFATGTGSTASPATMALGAEGNVTAANVSQARQL